MRWRQQWPERIPRPKARRLTDKERSTILAALTRAIAASPVLSYLGVHVRAQRGRFYLERHIQEEDETEVEVLGRITPLAAANGAMLLETENRSGSWSEEAKGTALKVIKAVASDTEGIMTTQTAIKNLHPDAADRKGTRITSRFKQFVEEGSRAGLFVVLDEAHHAPAYGCRHLLVGQDDSAPGIRSIAPQTNLLGLTATPTYTDEARRGWLGKVFEAGIIYQADKARLTAQGILARPNYIPRPTGRELVVSDSLYNRLVREHKELPVDRGLR
jgi:hypothetical protein